MGHPVIFQGGDYPCLFRAGKYRDGGGLLFFLILHRLLCVVHVDAFGIRDGKHPDETQLRDFLRRIQEMVYPDDVIRLQLVGQAGSQRFHSQGDGHLPGGDAV